MRQAGIVFILICLLTGRLYAQSTYTAGGRAMALGDAALLVHDVWAVHNNPSDLGDIRHWQVGLWTERRYNLSELSNGALAIAIPLKKHLGTVGFGLYVFGGTVYFRQQKFNLSYALPLSRKLTAGIGLHLLHTRLVEPYGSTLSPIGEVSVLYKLNSKTQAAVRIWNIYPVQIADWQQEHLPMIASAGIRRIVSKSLFLLAQISHETNQKTSVQCGLEYKPGDKIDLQAGVRTGPMAYTFGAGFQYQKIHIHLGFQVMQVLGVTPNVTFNYAPPADK